MKGPNLYLEVPKPVPEANRGYLVTDDIERAAQACAQRYSFGVVRKIDDAEASFAPRPTLDPEVNKVLMAFPASQVVVLRQIGREIYCYPYLEERIVGSYYVPVEEKAVQLEVQDQSHL